MFGINGYNFVRTMLKLVDISKTEIKVVFDQLCSVTYTYYLAKLICCMIFTEKYEIYHATNDGMISWAKFAEQFFKYINKNVKVNYVTIEKYYKWFRHKLIDHLILD